MLQDMLLGAPAMAPESPECDAGIPEGTEPGIATVGPPLLTGGPTAGAGLGGQAPAEKLLAVLSRPAPHVPSAVGRAANLLRLHGVHCSATSSVHGGQRTGDVH